MPPDRDLTSAHGRRNRARWDTKSAEYQRRNAPLLDLPFLGWGLWHLPESELQVLGDVRGKPYGEWIRLFRRSGFVVEDLIEPRPPADATSTYRNADELAWARRWPMEQLWKVRKAPR